MEKEEIEKLAEKEYPFPEKSEAYGYVEQREAYIKGYQKSQEELNRKAAMLNPPNLDDVLTKQDRGVCKDCYYAGAFTCEH